ncbi:MAG: PLxRFG domain-containing protein, partial [Paracoccus sp. (in: a-proteobacteria)]|nr:PLxRFG domain-containing protein [Paracoccus sp. (in: a-proteobacteria)]
FGADDDDVDEWLQDALLIEGDGPGVAAWNWTMGLALNGVPGQVTGLALTDRIGMPDLWFRSPLQEVEGKDLWAHYTEQALGPGIGIAGNMLAGLSMVSDGKYMRGMEKMVPIWAGNVLKSGRYISEGVTTYGGDPIIESVNPYQALMQASGFTPAKIAERYNINNRLKRHEKDALDTRKGILREIGDAIRNGGPIPPNAVDKLRAFNAKWPEYPITTDSIRQSIKSRQRASQRNEFGVTLNAKLNDRIRAERAPALYN